MLQAQDARARPPPPHVVDFRHPQGRNMLSQLHHDINQLASKEHPDGIELAQDCAVRIVRRKGKSAPYRGEQSFVGQLATCMSIHLSQNVS